MVSLPHVVQNDSQNVCYSFPRHYMIIIIGLYPRTYALLHTATPTSIFFTFICSFFNNSTILLLKVAFIFIYYLAKSNAMYLKVKVFSSRVIFSSLMSTTSTVSKIRSFLWAQINVGLTLWSKRKITRSLQLQYKPIP